MDIYYDETASQVISKVAKFLSRFPPRGTFLRQVPLHMPIFSANTVILTEKNAIDIYNILLERLDKKEQNELLPVLQHSVSMYTFHTTGIIKQLYNDVITGTESMNFFLTEKARQQTAQETSPSDIKLASTMYSCSSFSWANLHRGSCLFLQMERFVRYPFSVC